MINPIKKFLNWALKVPPSIEKTDQKRQTVLLLAILLFFQFIGILVIITDFLAYDKYSMDYQDAFIVGIVAFWGFMMAYTIVKAGYYKAGAVFALVLLSLFMLTPAAVEFHFYTFFFLPLLFCGFFLPIRALVFTGIGYLIAIFFIPLYVPGWTYSDILLQPLFHVVAGAGVIIVLIKNRDLLEKDRQAVLQEEKSKVTQEKSKLSHIISSIGDGVFVLNRKKEIILVNPTALKLTGYTEKELMNKHYESKFNFVIGKDKKIKKSFINDIFKKGAITKLSHNSFITRKNGSFLPVATSAAPILNQVGRIVGCVIVFRDVSKDRLVNRMKSDFISFTSHQLRTPLTRIRWILELLLSREVGPVNKPQGEYLNDILKGTIGMTHLVEDLLDVSLIETEQKLPVQLVKINLIRKVKQTVSELRILAEERNITVEILKTVPKKCLVEADERKIQQVFYNLIDNAIKYSNPNKTVTIDVKDERDKVTVVIHDRGIGIPKEEQKKILSRFFRARNATFYNGSGLGLYICHSIVKAHKGGIWFESKEGKGTIFYVQLPKNQKG